MTNAKARFNNSLRPRNPEGSLGRTAQDVHLDSHTAPELWVILNEWLHPFIARIFNIHGSRVLIALFGCCMAGATWSCCRLGASSVYTTIQPCTSLQCHFIQSHTGLNVCLAVACRLHFRRNDRDLLRVTAVTRGRSTSLCIARLIGLAVYFAGLVQLAALLAFTAFRTLRGPRMA